MRTNARTATWVAGVLGLTAGAVVGLLVMLIVIDSALIAFHLSMKYLGHPEEYVFDLGADRSYGEFFQYVKNVWAILLLALLALRRRAGVYVAWAIVCAYFLIDDAFQLHERAGWAAHAAFPGVSAAMHVAELAWLAGVGLLLTGVVIAAHLRAAPEDRAVSAVLVVLFGVLIVFGVVVDAVHHLVFPARVFDAPFTTLEDGGELLALSLVVAFLFAVALCAHRPQLSGAWTRLAGTTQPQER